MAKSFLPTIFEHPYEIDPKYGKSVAYFSMEYAIDNSFKIYSGGLGYLSGSHMRSAHDLRHFLGQDANCEAAKRLGLAERLSELDASIEALGSPEYRASLVGTIGRQPLAH